MLEMSKTKRLLAILAIMSTAIAVMADLALTPVYGLIYAEYPNSIGYVNYFISGPMLIVVIASLLTGVILKRVNKKVVMVTGGIIFAVGALFGNLFDNLLYMCIMRTLVGIGAGVTNVVALALVSDIYEDTATRAKITGYYNAALSLVGTVFSYLGGILGEPPNTWNNVFKIYWSAIPMVILLILFIPSIKPAGSRDRAAETDSAVKKETLGWRFWWMSFSFFVFNLVLGATVLYYISPFIIENGIGGSGFAGMATSVKSIVGFFIALGFGFLYTKLGRHTSSVLYIIAAVTLLIVTVYPSEFTILVVATICACTYKLAMPYAYAHGSSIVPASQIALSISIVTAVYGIGSFLSTYYATWLRSVTGSDTFTNTWIVNVSILAVMFIAEIVIVNIEKKKFGVKAT